MSCAAPRPRRPASRSPACSPGLPPAALPAAEPSPLERLGLAVGRRNPTDTLPDDLFADGLLTLHRDLLLGVIDQAMRHLEARTSGGSTLLSMQLVQGQLADIALQLN